jgi:hypothetical protein
MPRLFLDFKDENGADKSVEVTGPIFVVGRHSACDLCILNGSLSREHATIELRNDRYFIRDNDSSNGTTLNGSELIGDARLHNGDEIRLGGAVSLRVKIDRHDCPASADMGLPARLPVLDPANAPVSTVAGQLTSPSPTRVAGIPPILMILVPLMGLTVIAIVVGAALLLGGRGDSPSARDDENDPLERPSPRRGKEDPADTPARAPSPATQPSLPPDAAPSPGTPAGNGAPSLPSAETAKVERKATAFVRQIVWKDPRAFLTGEQAAKVDAKIKQIAGSASLAEHLTAAGKNSAALRAIAQKAGLKPHFLAVAAITKLGTGRGDIIQAAKEIADPYNELRIQIGNDLVDEALLMVAAYDRAVDGDARDLGLRLQSIGTKATASSRELRTIWYLEKTGGIKPAEYDRVLFFLAVGTIAQNPAEFGVKAEALRL